MQHTLNPIPLRVADLHFDPLNPRLTEFGISQKTLERDILKTLWEAMDVKELVQSIAASGFFRHEALVVAHEKGKNIVIEGNRRLAAVKVLLSPGTAKENGWDIPDITPAARKKLEELPVIVSDREKSWRYLGFKHVNGPAKWTSYAKAAYIAEVHSKYHIALSDIANQIGDQHNTVQRLYRGLMVLEQAERAGVYEREDRYNARIYFSHLYTGLDYKDGIAAFLNIAPPEKETSSPVPKNKLKELGELCVWLYGSKKAKQPPIVVTQNPDLKYLNAALTKRESLAALRDGVPLDKVFEISRPPEEVFEQALIAAKRELTTARAYLLQGYDDSEALLRIAGTIADLAEDIYKEMDRKHRPEVRKKRLTEN